MGDRWACLLVTATEQTIMTTEDNVICQCPSTAGFHCLPVDNEEMDRREDHTSAETSGQSSFRPEDSDFLPSVRLAAVLFLIFSLVSFLLFCSSTHQGPIHRSRRTGHSILKDYRLEKLRLLFPSQTEDIWNTLERKLGQQWFPDGRKSAVDIPFIAVAQGGSRNTLLCLTKNIISAFLATEQIPVPVTTSELAEFGRVHFFFRPHCINEWPVMSIAAVGKGKNGTPCGIHVGIHCSLDGDSSMWKTTFRIIPAMHNPDECMSQNTASDLFLEIMSSFNQTGRVPSTLWLNSVGRLPVMNVNVEDYLENSFVC